MLSQFFLALAACTFTQQLSAYEKVYITHICNNSKKSVTITKISSTDVEEESMVLKPYTTTAWSMFFILKKKPTGWDKLKISRGLQNKYYKPKSGDYHRKIIIPYTGNPVSYSAILLY